MSGPLAGTRVVEVAGIGPGPFAGMLLADAGADVIRVDRAGERTSVAGTGPLDVVGRGRRSVAVDLKRPEGVEVVLRLAAGADVLIEGFRPGVAERLGIGPEPCLARNRALVYGRMTGWGQDGPLAHAAGHDIAYIALAGMLHLVGRPEEPPPPPVNVVGDYGGGGMLLAFGVACALLEARRTGRGQVVDAAIVDGTALLTALFHGLRAGGRWTDARGAHLLDGGAPFYGSYECADGRYVAVGALEPKFSAELLDRLGVSGDDELRTRLYDPSAWPQLRERLAAIFRTRTRDEWTALLEGTDACFAPVLTLGEAPGHPHNAARGTFTEVAGVVQPAPAPRFSATPGGIARPAPEPGADTDAILRECGYGGAEIEALRAGGAVR
ncbi:MAG TPA: CaiB/BaiF CoA-transferase family protein [Candidatus Dormibacteraeota bacterium]|nr:CaiB/BaiF CoA-transferase family protein [Candidatus Dormibacteraeota bacterium]